MTGRRADGSPARGSRGCAGPRRAQSDRSRVCEERPVRPAPAAGGRLDAVPRPVVRADRRRSGRDGLTGDRPPTTSGGCSTGWSPSAPPRCILAGLTSRRALPRGASSLGSRAACRLKLGRRFAARARHSGTHQSSLASTSAAASTADRPSPHHLHPRSKPERSDREGGTRTRRTITTTREDGRENERRTERTVRELLRPACRGMIARRQQRKP